jgi:general secretion pathway protein A
MVLITGEVGAGKTLVANVLSLRLRRSTVLINIADPLVRGDQLMRCVHNALISPSGKRLDRLALQTSLTDRLIAMQRMGQRVAVLVDECQDLSKGALEQLRLMSNWENRAEKLIQWLMIGQPEMRERLQKPAWEHLRQRIVLSFHLQRLGVDQIGDYVEHRLMVASGGTPKIRFEPGAYEEIGKASGGVPRLINNVCDSALLAAFAADSHVVSRDTVLSVVNEMTTCGWGNSGNFAENNYQGPTRLAA